MIVSNQSSSTHKKRFVNVRKRPVNRLLMMNTHTKILSWYDDYADELFGFALVKTQSRDEAKECVQETFLRICTYLQKQKEIKNPRAFLYRILKNIIVDGYRKYTPDSLEETIEASGEQAHPSAEQSFEKTITAKHILRTLEKIDERYRKPFIMRYVHDLSPKEIAKTLRISENTASVRIHRAKTIAQELFKDKAPSVENTTTAP
jgi:RNA polymerase sigma-70 factor, ECF subfamily